MRVRGMLMTEKACTVCGVMKSRDEFYPTNRKGRKPSIMPACKACTLKSQKTYYERNSDMVKDRVRRWNLQKFGITEDDYMRMLKAQGGRCYICQKKPRSDRRLAVDHDHRTGEFRGLLCGHCNHILLGTFHENVDLFQRAADYLTEPPSRQVFATPRRHVDAPPQRA